ncbi:MAG TPA: DUF3578 domain-containing protein [Thermoanaerobaculia bacterium]|nr:DUF3578 domain-containing protein [Thermoanaerobaculia bacterium]
MSIQESIEFILGNYLEAREGPFAGERRIRSAFEDLIEEIAALPFFARYPSLDIKFSMGKGSWARVPFVMLYDTRETTSARRGVYCAILFREDMSGLYITLNQGATQAREQVPFSFRSALTQNATRIRELLPKSLRTYFNFDGNIDLRTSGQATAYEAGTIVQNFYERGRIPPDEQLGIELDLLVQAYESVLRGDRQVPQPAAPPALHRSFDRAEATERLITTIAATGFHFQPWQIATYVTALRTKPFVILAGVSGTGKSRLPGLVAKGTASSYNLIAVRPDWTDSADVIGYSNLQKTFVPGAVLRDAQRAATHPETLYTTILDEMNLARVELYFAEVLSFIESRERLPGGGFQSRPLVSHQLSEEDAHWGEVRLPPNLAIVGTVNMDESSHGFSRKVLDRAFTIELSDIDLGVWRPSVTREAADADVWPASAWYPRATRLADLGVISVDDEQQIVSAIETVKSVNALLLEAQLQIGFRVRDEIALFMLNASEVEDAFRTTDGAKVDPLDLALHMKILPRIIGGSLPVQRAVIRMLGWAITGEPFRDEDAANLAVAKWTDGGRPSTIAGARFPRTAARLALMWDRFTAEGHTSFWL